MKNKFHIITMSLFLLSSFSMQTHADINSFFRNSNNLWGLGFASAAVGFGYFANNARIQRNNVPKQIALLDNYKALIKDKKPLPQSKKLNGKLGEDHYLAQLDAIPLREKVEHYSCGTLPATKQPLIDNAKKYNAALAKYNNAHGKNRYQRLDDEEGVDLAVINLDASIDQAKTELEFSGGPRLERNAWLLNAGFFLCAWYSFLQFTKR